MLEYGSIFGEPQKKTWTMMEVVQKCAKLPGVTGAILSTFDGLPVASSWPGSVKPESVAAFIPQIYSKLFQYSSELNLGRPAYFTLLIENLPLQVYKTGNSYLAVVGRPGENLPKTQLMAVALRLAAE